MVAPLADRRGLEGQETRVSDEVELHSDVAVVDWERLKADLSTDDFDNGRSAEELRNSFAASHTVVFAELGGRTVGTARLLADGICNAYLIDVWTHTPLRRRGIATQMVKRCLAAVPGHHVALFTDRHRAFYTSLGFEEEQIGMSQVAGQWLNR
jgi:GNAT superfamily N-acetyltransferase